MAFSCYDSIAERTADGVRYPPVWGGESDVSFSQSFQRAKITVDRCFNHESTKDIGSLIGTAFVARDMMQIVDALEDDGLLRYWGRNHNSTITVYSS